LAHAGLSYSLRHIGHTQSQTCNVYNFKTCGCIAIDSLWLLFTQYKATWLTAISGHCLAALSARISALTSRQQHAAKRLLS